MRHIGIACAALGSGLFIIACGVYPGEQRAAWRDESEKACMRSGAVVASPKIVPVEPIGGNGPCGMSYPFKVSELPASRVALSKPTTMSCPMIPVLDNWMKDIVQPAAMQQFNTYVTEVETVGSYSCRRINGSGTLSEHAFGNAMDVTGFKLADGRRIKVGKGFVQPSADQFQMSAEEEYQPQPQASYAPRAKAREDWEQLVLESLGDEGDGPGDGYNTQPRQYASLSPPYQGGPQNQFTPAQDGQDFAFLDMVRSGACTNFSTVLGPGQADHEDHLHFDLAHRRSGKRVCK
ncbi:MAG: extensin family protein [Pseudomonadota bacterium]